MRKQGDGILLSTVSRQVALATPKGDFGLKTQNWDVLSVARLQRLHQPSLFRAKESPLKKEIIQEEKNSCSEMLCRNLGPLKYLGKRSCFLLAGSLVI